MAASARNITIIHVTQNITNYSVIGNHIVHHGLGVHLVEQVTRDAVPHYHLEGSRTRGPSGPSAPLRPQPRLDYS